MPNVLIAFASRSGNTEEIALLIEKNLKKAKLEVIMKEIGYDRIDPASLADYDSLLIGTYTEGDGDIPYEAEAFFDDLDEADLADKPAAFFGSCDSLYPDYGGAVDQFEDKLKKKEARIELESLKIELSPDKRDEERCREFANAFAALVLRENSTAKSNHS